SGFSYTVVEGEKMMGASARSRRTLSLQAAALATLGVAGLIHATAARAADVHWISLDGSWGTATNWSTLAVPVSTDRAVLDFVTPGATARVNTVVPDVLAVSVTNGNVLSVEGSGSLNIVDNTDPSNGV